MDSNLQSFTRCPSLNNIPIRKLHLKLESLKDKPTNIKSLKTTAYNRYYESNIPIEYWELSMEKDFHGYQPLKDTYDAYVKDLKTSYMQGKSLCLAGTHGCGKTSVVCCMLKKASEKGYNCLYTTLSDIVAVLTSAPYEERFIARKELCIVDFLVIDEFDNRFTNSDSASDLYARTLEIIFRTRVQNKLPTLICTNSPNIVATLNGALKESVESLFQYIQIVPVLGTDYRKIIKEKSKNVV
jgi:DNA replication protein DnaC